MALTSVGFISLLAFIIILPRLPTTSLIAPDQHKYMEVVPKEIRDQQRKLIKTRTGTVPLFALIELDQQWSDERKEDLATQALNVLQIVHEGYKRFKQ